MADVKWIKITTDIFDDEKIVLIEAMPESDSLIVIWFKLLCLAGKQNNGGVFIMNNLIAYTDEMLATIFRRKVTTVKLALDTFEAFGMIERINGAITIPNWEKHQNIDGLEKIRESTRKRVGKYRERQKMIECNVTDNVTCNVTVTSCNGTDKNRLDKNRTDKKRLDSYDEQTNKPPTLDDVKAYCDERNSTINPEKFFNWYDSRNWEGIYNWKGMVISWEEQQRSTKKSDSSTNRFTKCEQRRYSEEELQEIERKLLGG